MWQIWRWRKGKVEPEEVERGNEGGESSVTGGVTPPVPTFVRTHGDGKTDCARRKSITNRRRE